jgi:hypothetical protein
MDATDSVARTRASYSIATSAHLSERFWDIDKTPETSSKPVP